MFHSGAGECGRKYDLEAYNTEINMAQYWIIWTKSWFVTG